jgi:hypothetical protein
MAGLVICIIHYTSVLNRNDPWDQHPPGSLTAELSLHALPIDRTLCALLFGPVRIYRCCASQLEPPKEGPSIRSLLICKVGLSLCGIERYKSSTAQKRSRQGQLIQQEGKDPLKLEASRSDLASSLLCKRVFTPLCLYAGQGLNYFCDGLNTGLCQADLFYNVNADVGV